MNTSDQNKPPSKDKEALKAKRRDAVTFGIALITVVLLLLAFFGITNFGNLLTDVDNFINLVFKHPSSVSKTSQTSTTTPPATQQSSSELGHILAVIVPTSIRDDKGNLIARCNSSQLGLRYNVVVASNQTIMYQGSIYYNVYYPDSCRADLDFTAGLTAFVNKNALVETDKALPDSHNTSMGSEWEDCWPPNGCANQFYTISGTSFLSASGDSEFLAWIMPSGEVNPFWWHAVAPDGSQCALYARDWNAQSN